MHDSRFLYDTLNENMKKKQNKWKQVFVIKGKSSYGTEDIDEFDTMSEARKMIKEYRLAMPTFSLQIIKRKVLNDLYVEVKKEPLLCGTCGKTPFNCSANCM